MTARRTHLIMAGVLEGERACGGPATRDDSGHRSEVTCRNCLRATEPGRVQREAPELGDAAGRLARALVKRARTGDHEGLEQLALVRAEVDRCTGDAARALVASGHYSWADVGEVLGITRQAARQRFASEATGAPLTASTERATA